MPRNREAMADWRRPSIIVVLGGGALTIFFLIAIVREVIRTTTVRRQVARLEAEVASEGVRQTELNDLIGYLSSPTFQEREARLRLGLKKSGERVIVIPNDPATKTTVSADGTTTVTPEQDRPIDRWWNYFFGDRTTS